MKSGNIPIIKVIGNTLPEAWEKSVIATWQKGADIRTEYDKPQDPPSKDCTMVIVINKPFSEPRIHRAFPGGLEDLEIYRQEVICGIHDHWINPKEGKWTYTYHQKLFSYQIEDQKIDQINYIINKLATREYSRRANAITWNPKTDPPTDDPPCLQRIWFRILRNKKGEAYLNMNAHWRSRDAYKAAFMNMFAFTELQKDIAQQLSKIKNEKIDIGRYVDISDSYHIYGSYYKDLEGFIRMTKERSFAERTWTTEFAQPFFKEAQFRIEQEQKIDTGGT